MIYVGEACEPPRAAFATARHLGNAVKRNQVRRRLRAALREHSSLLEPGHAYLVRARPEARDRAYAQLLHDLERALRKHSRGASEQ